MVCGTGVSEQAKLCVLVSRLGELLQMYRVEHIYFLLRSKVKSIYIRIPWGILIARTIIFQ